MLDFRFLDPQYPNIKLFGNFLGSCSLVGIGKFNLLFLWLLGVVRIGFVNFGLKGLGLIGREGFRASWLKFLGSRF